MSVVMLLMCIGGMLLMTPYELGYYYYYLKEKNIRWDWVNKIQALIILSYQCNIYIYYNQYTVYSFSYTRRFRIVFGVPQSIVQVRARLTGWNPLGCHGPNGGHDCGRCGGAGPGGVLGWHSRYAWPGFCLRESSLLDHPRINQVYPNLGIVVCWLDWRVGFCGFGSQKSTRKGESRANNSKEIYRIWKINFKTSASASPSVSAAAMSTSIRKLESICHVIGSWCTRCWRFGIPLKERTS